MRPGHARRIGWTSQVDMTTVLTIIALMLVASAIWGLGPRSGTDVSRTNKSKGAAMADLSGPQSAASTSKRRSKFKNLAMGPIQNLGGVATRPRWIDYVPLAVLVFCLLIFDTRTWLQRGLLSFLAIAAAFLLWFCLSRATSADTGGQ